MASRVVTRGLQQIGEIASGVSAAPKVQTMAVDDSTVAFLAADTQLGSPTNEFDAALTATRSGQTISHAMTIPTGSGNFHIRRISLHNDTPGNVSGSSTTLIAGIDGQSLIKSADFALTLTVKVVYA